METIQEEIAKVQKMSVTLIPMSRAWQSLSIGLGRPCMILRTEPSTCLAGQNPICCPISLGLEFIFDITATYLCKDSLNFQK